MAESLTRVHGGLDEVAYAALRALSVDPSTLVDFSVNLNPYGPCEPVLAAARAAPLARYPDASARAARTAWAQLLGRTPEQVAVGHGAADLFWAIARAVVSPGARVAIAEPTFSEFRIAAQAAAAEVVRVHAAPERGFLLDLPALIEAGRGACALYLCSPNNPTGEYLAPARIAALAQALPETLIVLDQSFLGLTDVAQDAHVLLPDNVLCVRSLTKEFACPGLRIGLCTGAAAWIQRVEAMRPTWATSSPALLAIEASAGQAAFVQASWQRIRADRDATTELLRARGLACLPSATSYQLVALPCDALVFWQRMLAQGVLVRDASSFGLPRHVRIAALPAPERARLAAALDVVLSA